MCSVLIHRSNVVFELLNVQPWHNDNYIICACNEYSRVAAVIDINIFAVQQATISGSTAAIWA